MKINKSCRKQIHCVNEKLYTIHVYDLIKFATNNLRDRIFYITKHNYRNSDPYINIPRLNNIYEEISREIELSR